MAAQNTLITNAVVAKEVMAMFHNKIKFIKGINKQYSKEFNQTGAKIGTTINVKKAPRYNVQQGPNIVPQGTNEETVPLTLNRWWTVPMIFGEVERRLMLQDFRKNYVTPAATKLAAVTDVECHAAAVIGTYPTANQQGSYACPGAGPIASVIGTPGTAPGTSGGSGLAVTNAPAVFLNAGVVLDNFAAPDDGRRTFLLNSAAQAGSVNGLSGLYNPQNIISEQYKSGLIGNALGFDFVKDQNVYTFQAGTRVATATDTVDTTAAAFATAGTSSTTITYTAGSGNNGKTIVAGDVFNIDGIYSVNPETQQANGTLFPFVCTEAITLSTGANTVKVSAFKVAGSGVADGSIVAKTTAANAAVSFISGAASAYSSQNLFYHEDAFTLGTADLETDLGLASSGAISDVAREEMDGISLRIVTFWDGMTSAKITRIDLLGGFSVQRQEWAGRLAGS